MSSTCYTTYKHNPFSFLGSVCVARKSYLNVNFHQRSGGCSDEIWAFLPDGTLLDGKVVDGVLVYDLSDLNALVIEINTQKCGVVDVSVLYQVKVTEEQKAVVIWLLKYFGLFVCVDELGIDLSPKWLN